MIARALAAAVTTRTRFALACTGVVSASGKIAAVLTAQRIGAGDSRGATWLAALTGLLFVVQRALGARARVRVEGDLHRATVQALLGSDLLEVPKTPFEVAIYESGAHAVLLVSVAIPELIASLAALLYVGPILATTLTARFLSLAGAALVGLVLVFVAIRAVASRAESRLTRVNEGLHKKLATAIDGRLDLVARAHERAFEGRFERALGELEAITDRVGPLLAFLGRAPLAAGACVVALLVVVDPSSRESLFATVLSQALLLTAAAPIVLGVPLRAQEVLRARVRVRSFVELLALPRVPAGGSRVPGLPAVVEARDVSYRYAPEEPLVVARVSFRWEPGTVLVVEGPNGSGKSTLLRLLLALRQPSDGVLSFGEHDVADLDVRALRARIAYLPQRPYLGQPFETVADAIHLLEPDAKDEAMRSVLGRTGLRVTLEKRIGELSGGQRQRLALARMLLQDAALVLLDEPDASLDAKGIDMLVALVGELTAMGRMVAIAAHGRELATLAGVHVTLRA